MKPIIVLRRWSDDALPLVIVSGRQRDPLGHAVGTTQISNPHAMSTTAFPPVDSLCLIFGRLLLLLSLVARVVEGHVGAWNTGESRSLSRTESQADGDLGIGMFCFGGNQSGVDDQNTNNVVNPLFNVRLWN
jgi:hypothetical protein